MVVRPTLTVKTFDKGAQKRPERQIEQSGQTTTMTPDAGTLDNIPGWGRVNLYRSSKAFDREVINYHTFRVVVRKKHSARTRIRDKKGHSKIWKGLMS